MKTSTDGIDKTGQGTGGTFREMEGRRIEQEENGRTTQGSRGIKRNGFWGSKMAQ